MAEFQDVLTQLVANGGNIPATSFAAGSSAAAQIDETRYATRNITAANFQRWNAARSRVDAGVGRGLLIAAGNSKQWGLGGGNNANGINGSKATAPASKIASVLSGLGIAAIEQSWLADGGLSDLTKYNAYDPRIAALPAAWPADTSTTLGGHAFVNTTDTTSALAFTPTIQTDTCVGYTVQSGSFGNITLDADGAGAVTILGSASPNILRTTYTTTLGTHTYNFKRATGTAKALGMRCYNSAIPAIDCMNMGFNGSTFAQWASTLSATAPLTALAAQNADLVVFECLTNTWNAAAGFDQTALTAALAVFSSQLDLFISTIKPVSDILFVVDSQSNPATLASLAIQQAFIDVLNAKADASGCGVLNMTIRFGPYSDALARGFIKTGDDRHESNVGYSYKGRAIATILART